MTLHMEKGAMVCCQARGAGGAAVAQGDPRTGLAGLLDLSS